MKRRIIRTKHYVLVAMLLLQMMYPICSKAMDHLGYFRQGTIYLEQGKLDLAISAFTHAIKDKPSYVAAYNNRALAYYEQGKTREAEADFHKALELDPGNDIANSNLGVLCLEKGEYELSLKYLEKAARKAKALKPHYATIFRNLAFVYRRLGRMREAEASFQTALSIEANLRNQQLLTLKHSVSKQLQERRDHLLVLKVWQSQ